MQIYFEFIYESGLKNSYDDVISAVDDFFVSTKIVQFCFCFFIITFILFLHFYFHLYSSYFLASIIQDFGVHIPWVMTKQLNWHHMMKAGLTYKQKEKKNQMISDNNLWYLTTKLNIYIYTHTHTKKKTLVK